MKAVGLEVTVAGMPRGPGHLGIAVGGVPGSDGHGYCEGRGIET
jgi:hypothetical protein